MAVLEAATVEVTTTEARVVSMQHKQMVIRFNDGVWRGGRPVVTDGNQESLAASSQWPVGSGRDG